ncbi:MAG: hemolysin family protein [Hyphomicrobiales bacterium]|nr:hemolysin family protein [Hyphomicrobiales bacterium]
MSSEAQPTHPIPAADPTDEEAELRRETGWLARLKSSLGLVSDQTLRESLETALERPEHLSAAFSPEERLMLLNILGFRELRIEDVMVPRADIIACEERVQIGKLLRIFRSAGHSRIPVYRETLDDPTGMVHIKDLMSWMTEQAQKGRRRARGAAAGTSEAERKPTADAGLDLRGIDFSKPLTSAEVIRPVLFVPPSMPAVDLLVKMQTTHIHLALVVDEYGGTDGLVSIEDLVEEIVGEIEDEHDLAHAARIEPTEDGGYIVDARFPIEDFREKMGRDLGLTAAEEEVDTLGGLVFSELGRIPVRGEIVTYNDHLEFEVLDADPRRIKKLKVFIQEPGEARKRRAKRAHGETPAAGGGD